VLVYLVYRIIHQFSIAGQLQAKYWSFFLKETTWQFIGSGLLSTLAAALGAMIVSFTLAMLLMLGRICKSKLLNGICTVLIEITRGIPTLLFVYFFLLVAPQFGLRLDAYWKITLSVAISACGVVAEVLRSGVNSVPKGQREAALSLGMQESHVFFRIIFPQAFRYVIPALIAELVIVLKDTTFAYVVNYADLMQNAKVLISNYDALVSVYFVIAVIYILINYALNKISGFAAHRLNMPVAKAKGKE
jgi:glutamate transport system permease protein